MELLPIVAAQFPPRLILCPIREQTKHDRHSPCLYNISGEIQVDNLCDDRMWRGKSDITDDSLKWAVEPVIAH